MGVFLHYRPLEAEPGFRSRANPICFPRPFFGGGSIKKPARNAGKIIFISLTLLLLPAGQSTEAQEVRYRVGDLIELLQGGVTPARILTLVASSCVEQGDDELVQEALRAAGATPELLRVVERFTCRDPTQEVVNLRQDPVSGASEMASLRVQLRGTAFAYFSVDGEGRFEAPTRVDLSPGIRIIRVFRTGYVPVVDTVTVTAGVLTERTYVLRTPGGGNRY